MATKSNLKKRKNPPFGRFPISKRVAAPRTSYVKLVVYHYAKQNFGVASNIRARFRSADIWETEVFTIPETSVASVNIAKQIANPSGTFDIMLFPGENWKQKVSPGDWVAIYFYNQEETSPFSKTDPTNLVMMGNIDRIAKSMTRNEDDDKLEVRYQVSGRNFGKVFEETELWFDPYAVQENTLDATLRKAGLEIIGNPTSQIDQLLNIFLGGGQNYGKGGRTKPLKQWRIPTELSELFGVDNYAIDSEEPLFFDVMKKEIEKNLPGYKTRNMLSLGSNGNLWTMLQKSSNSIVNEIFLEEVRTDDGKAFPTIVVRPRPFTTPFFDSQFGKELSLKGLLNDKHTTLQDLSKESFLELTQAEIFFDNTGKDDHSRFNMFTLMSNRATDYTRSIYAGKNSKGQIGNPFFQRESVNRYGLKRLEDILDFDQPTGKIKEVTSELQLFKAFMAQMYDFHYANHLYENGTMETSGVLEAELGKTLVVLPDVGSEAKKKIYYIEGYEHKWQFPSTWRTVFTVTRGQYQTSDLNIFIDVEGSRVTDFGKNDTDFDGTYLAKTEYRKQ